MRLGWSALLIASLLTAPSWVAAETHTDDELGYSIVVPEGYRAIPIAGEEKYIVAKWQSEREYVDKKEGFSGFRPEIKVVLFDPKGHKTAEAQKDGDTTVFRINSPYKNYKEWLKSDESGGRFISKEEEITVNGTATTWYEVAYQKLTVPRHGLAYVYHAEDIDYCVTVEVLEQNWDKLSPNLFHCLKTFKLFPRKGTVKRETTGEGGDVTITDKRDLDKLTPEERLKRRTDRFEHDLKVATDRLTAGWTVKRSKNYAALSHVDDRYTQYMLDVAEAVRAWAEANLGYFGPGLAGPETIRICKDYDEERAFRDTSSRSGWVNEITVSRTEGFSAIGDVAGEIFRAWRRDKNSRLSLPPWLSMGINKWIGSAYLKGSKLEFKADGDLIVALKLAAKGKTLIGPRDMMQLSLQDLIDRDKSSDPGSAPGGIPLRGFGQSTSAWQQSAGVVRYLLAGPGRTSARTKELLKTYITQLDAYLKEQDEKPASGESYKAPTSEEEEDAAFKNRETYWKDHEKDLLKAVFERTFKEWTEADWTAFEKSYKAFAS